MSVSNWNKRWSERENVNREPAAAMARALAYWTGRPGRALDLACGAGRHALLLARRGWTVTAVDAAAAALELVREAGEARVTCVEADLEAHEFAIAPESYEFVCDFYYLQRDLFGEIAAGVTPGGLFVAEIPMVDPRPEVPAMNPEYLLSAGELAPYFAGWDILEYEERIPAQTESGGHRRMAATLIARKPLPQ